MAIWSPSRIKAFFTCPQRHMFDLEADQPQDDKPYFQVGHAVHELVERYTLACWEAGDDMDNEVGMRLMEEIKADLDPAIWSDFEDVACTYLESHLIAPRPDVGSLETMLALGMDHEPCDYENPNALIRGRIDRWGISDGALLISDVKTNRIIINRDQVSSDIQLLCYAYMAWRHHKDDVSEVRIQLDFVRRVDKESNPCIVFERFEAGQLEMIKQWIDNRVVDFYDITSRGVKPKCKPGTDHENCKAYGGCPHLSLCPLCEKYQPPELITSDAEAAALQAWSKSAGTAKGKADRMVKAWVDQQGEVEGYGLKTMIGASRRYKYDGPKVWEVMEKKGKSFADFAKVVSVNAGKIPKSIKEEVQANLESTPETRVTVAKAT